MRKFIGTISILIISLSGFSQTSSTSPTLSLATSSTSVKVTRYSMYGKNGMLLTWPSESDTLEILMPLQIHFIKIGKTVYQITEHEPTIEKAPEPTSNLFFRSGIILGGNGSIYETPALNNSGILPLGATPITTPTDGK